MNDSAKRMEKLLQELHLSANGLAAALGIHPTNIYHILDGRNGISQRLTTLITSKYENIDPNWLQNGRGEMYVETGTRMLYNKSNIPLVLDYGYEFGKITIDKDSPRYDVPGMNEGFLIIVRDDAMSAEYNPGNIIGARYVELENPIIWGKNYLVLLDGIGFIRKLMPDSDNTIKAVALNDKYPDFFIKKESIVQLAKIHGKVELE